MPQLVSLAPTEPVQHQTWLIPNFIPRSELVLLDGASGVGKSLVTAMLASYFSHERIKMDDKLVLVLTSPEQRAGMIETLAHQMPNYDHLRGLEYQPEAADAATSIAPHLLRFIEAAIKEHQPAILFIDSLEELLELGGETDTRQLIDFWTGLRNLAHSHDCTLIIPRQNGLHENRQYGPFTRLGSDIARFGLTMHYHPTDSGQRVVTIAKNLRGPVGEQTHISIAFDGKAYFICTDPFEHVKPSRTPATWQPVPEHILEEDRRIIQLIEGTLQDKGMTLNDLEAVITCEAISKSAFQRALSKARLRQYQNGLETTYSANYHMLCRHFDKKYRSEKAREIHARAHATQSKDEEPTTRQPAHPKDLTVSRQAG